MVDPVKRNVEYEKELSLLTVTQLYDRWDKDVEWLRNLLHKPRPSIFNQTT